MNAAAPADASDMPAVSVQPEKRVAVRLGGDTRQVFAQLGELYGVRVVVDEELPTRRVALRLDETDFPTALRLTAELANAFWVRRDDGTILIAANTPEKHQQYEPQVVETFSLAGSKPEELAEVVRMFREVFEMRQIQADTRTSTFTVRDTPQRLALASQVLAQLRREPGEVMVEALLLEVDRERARRLGLLPPQRATVVHLGAGLVDFSQAESLIDILRPLLERGLIPETFLGVSLETLLAALATDPDLLQAALPPFILFGGGRTTFAANLPGAALNLLELASVAQSQRRVSLRARHGQEASVFLGERFPVTLATFSPLFFPPAVLDLIEKGLFVPPVPAIQYEELGLKVAVEPQLHERGEVTLRLKLDIRALSPERLNTLPIFSNRVIEQTVRLKAGEALLVSGVLDETREEIRRGTPVLGDVPGLGYLFSRRDSRVRSTELLILLAPHIQRAASLDPAAVRPLYVGTAARFSPLGPALAAPPAPPQPEGTPPPPPPRQQTRSWRLH